MLTTASYPSPIFNTLHNNDPYRFVLVGCHDDIAAESFDGCFYTVIVVATAN